MTHPAENGDLRERFVPHLDYPLHGRDLFALSIVSEAPDRDRPLASVREATAWMHRGRLIVVVRGPMLTRAGQPGPSRGLFVDLNARQPGWLSDLIADARRRLSECPIPPGGSDA